MNQTIRGYTLTQWLGSGGMGEVYQAFHTSTQRTVAIKLLSRPDQAERFRNEATVQASLRLPHIAQLYEFFLEGGLPCLVMEYVEGPTIEQLIRKKGPLSEELARNQLAQITSAVAYLHSRGIVHRDLKAGNIKLTRQNGVKLLDFGLARTAGSPKLTRLGRLIGTASSMAPEQFSGESTSASDCWALGVLLYEMLTGYTPFGGSTDTEMNRRIRKADYLPPRKLNPALSRAAERLIDRLLTVSPHHRPTAPQLLHVLQHPALLDSPDWVGQVRKWWEKLKS